jgi:hypothetical protein
MKKIWDPKSLVYILCHAVIFAIGIVLCTTAKVVLVAIGTSLIAAGIAGWVVFTYVFASQRVSESLEIVTDFGFIKAFEARQVRIKPEYDRLLEKAHERIDVIGFGLRALREDYLPEMSTWKQKADVRMLLIDPEFPNVGSAYANQRDLEEGDHAGTITQQVKKFVADTKAITELVAPHSFEVRLFRCLPSVNIFRVDNEMFWGPYLIKQPSRNSPTFLVRRGVLFDRLLQHFDRIWNDDALSRPVPADW